MSSTTLHHNSTIMISSFQAPCSLRRRENSNFPLLLRCGNLSSGTQPTKPHDTSTIRHQTQCPARDNHIYYGQFTALDSVSIHSLLGKTYPRLKVNQNALVYRVYTQQQQRKPLVFFLGSFYFGRKNLPPSKSQPQHPCLLGLNPTAKETQGKHQSLDHKGNTSPEHRQHPERQP